MRHKTIAALFFAFSLFSASAAFAATEIEQRTYNADKSVCYPYVVLEDEGAAKRINTITEGTAHNFVRLVKETREHSLGADVIASLSYEVTHNDDSTLSIVFTEYRYVGRAAHPMVSMRAMNFRLDSGERISAADLSAAPLTSGAKSSYTPEILKQRLREKAARERIPLNKKFEELSELPENFYFDKDFHVHFIFGQNEVAPAAFGIIDLDADELPAVTEP